ncbi:MAG: 3-hydroxyacyl-ACP dehydratase [Ferruginibacter sp.]
MNGLASNISNLIPQRPPFVMIDHLTWCDEKITRTVFLIKKDNIFVENGRFCEPGLVENIAQTAAARAGYVSVRENNPVQVGYIGAIKNLVIHSLPIVNEELVTEITVENQIFDVTLIKGRVSCNEELIAECEMKIFIQSK